MSLSSEPITIAFLGATGGCANACLAHTLKAGYKASALARTPSKLTEQLLSQGLDQATIDCTLTIIKGDAKDIDAVNSTICPEQNNGKLVSVIISGLGSYPKLQLSLFQPVTLHDPHICEDAAKTLVAATRQLLAANQPEGQQQTPPLVVVVSTTGITDGPNDVPFLCRFFYHHALAIPHEDKRKMDQTCLSAAAASSGNETQAFKGTVIIRPSLLNGDHRISTGKGWNNIRVGTEKKPAVGYSISRADVGQWIFEEIVKSGGDKWINHMVTLTN